MTEFTEDMYRSEKLRKYYGVSLFVDTDRARAHLRRLKGHPYYMSNARIGELSGLCESNLCQIIRGHRSEGRNNEKVGGIHRDTEAAILGVLPEINPPARGGGYVPPLGARRRLGALMAAGFPLKVLARGMDWGVDPQPVHRLITGKSGVNYVQHSTYAKACALYEKLANVKPEDMGYASYAIKRCKAAGARHGFAPPWAWDDDALDDPDAVPEWTGACGTSEGYRIHIRETFLKGNSLPVCGACRDAVETGNTVERYVFRTEWFSSLVEELNINIREMARSTGVSSDRIYRYKYGTSRPRSKADIEKIAAYMGITPNDLCELEVTDVIPGTDLKRGDFNRHTFRAVLDMGGLSQRKAAIMLNTSTTTVSNWINGIASPESPDVLKKLAKHFGVKAEEFYQ